MDDEPLGGERRSAVSGFFRDSHGRFDPDAIGPAVQCGFCRAPAAPSMDSSIELRFLSGLYRGRRFHVSSRITSMREGILDE